ncbi:phage tail protein [Bacillus sp. LL01]|uniref:phage tail protein n=1 Tax=Bacillus sp. LL01 TaxID=1665556 RepID=UPI00069F0650|nr:phage tail protein [Bacillus sp. LL01]
MLTITDLLGNTEALTDYKDLAIKRRINGERSLSFLLIATDRNAHAFDLVSEESIAEYNDVQYRIKLVEERNLGNRSVKRVQAHHVFFDLIDVHKYETFSGQRTLGNILNWTLADTGYSHTVIGTFASQEFENFGDDNVLALLQTILTRYGAEIQIAGTHLTFRAKIGVTTDMQLRYRHNVKTISKSIDSSKLSTYIRGYGAEGIEAEYTSSNAEIFGIRDAKPVRDERYTTEAGLLERLQRDLIDEPELSITAEYAELKRAGFTYEQFDLGDEIYVIYEPMGVDVMARIVEYEEYPEQPDATRITLANFRKNASDILADFGRVSKDVADLFEGKKRLPYNALDEAVRRATEALQSAQTELEFENGIIARSKINPNHLVLFNSAGVGVSVDGGQTFRTAMTGEGFVADLITTGTMLADRIQGGLFTLGGPANGNGRMQVLDADGELIADLDAEQRGFSGDLYVQNLISPTVVNYGSSDLTFYVSDQNEPNDNNDGLTWSTPLATINEALRRIPLFYDGQATINLRNGGTFYGDITFRGFIGRGKVTVDGLSQTTKVVGNVFAACNILTFEIKRLTLNARSSSYAAVSSVQNTYAIFRDLQVFGNGASFGIDFMQSGYGEVINSGVHNVEVAVSGRYGATAHLMTVSGKGSVRGVYAYAGYVVGTGQAPEGGVSNQAEQLGGKIHATFTYPTTTPVTPPSAPETKNTWSSTGSPKGDAWRPQFGGQWWNDGSVVQGGWGGLGAYSGLWLFGSAPSNAVTGKTIKSMRLYVERKAGGNSGNVNVTFRPHTYTSRPSGQPSYQSPSTQAGFSVGTKKWITIPSSFYAGFQNGTTKGIGIYVNSTSTSNYAKFNVDARLEITYA